MRVVPLTGGRGPAPRCCASGCADGRLVLPARRPRPRQRRRRGHLLRPAGDHARRARRCSPRRPAPPLVPGRLPVRRARVAARLPPEVPVAGPGRLRDRVATAMQARRRRLRDSIAEQPEDWHMLGRIWSRRAARPAGAGAGGCRRLMRIGLVCPYQWDVPGGVQYHVRDLAQTLRGMGHHVEVLPRPSEEDACRRVDHLRPAARCRCPTTARWPACSSARCRPPGSAAGCATAASTSSTCTSRPRRRCRSRSADRHGPDRRDLPRRHRPLEVARRRGADGPAVAGADHRPDRGAPTSPAACRSSTSAATP